MISEDCITLSDLRGAVTEMQENGAALISRGLKENFLSNLVAEVAAGPFEKIDTKVGLVEEVFERYAFLYRVEGMQYLEALRSLTESLVRDACSVLASLKDWSAKDTVIQKYDAMGGLSGHMDLKRHPDLIAIWTLVGSANIEILEGRYGPTLKIFRPEAGDLILLRGSGPGNLPEQRPFHRVSGSLGNTCRISATFRDNNTPEKIIPQFSYLNFSSERTES